MHSLKNPDEIKDRILHDAISMAIQQRKVMHIQNIIIVILTVCMGIVLARKAV